MTVESLNRTYVGFSNVILTRLGTTPLTLCLPKPQNVVLDPGVQIREQQGRDELGRMVRVRTYSTGTMPTAQLVFNHIQPELISLRVGQQFASGSFNTVRPKQLRITKGQFAAVGTGYAGYGLAADVEARASIIRNGLSFPLTRAVHADYSTWRTTDDKFSIGANAALNFSDNLVESQEIANITIPIGVTGRKLSEELVGDHQINCMMVDTDGRVGYLEIYTATPNLSDAAIDFSQESIQLSMFVNTPPGECVAWNIIDTDELVGCL